MLALALLLGLCGVLASAPRAAAASAPRVVVAAFGDSVPAGSACHCRAYPALFTDALARREKAGGRLTDESSGGMTTRGLLALLRTSRGRAAVAAADVVVVTVGANDLDESEVIRPSCRLRDPAGCSAGRIAAMGGRLDRALDTIAAVRKPSATVLVTGYWNVFLDGRVARARGSAYLRGSLAVTRAANVRIARSAAGHGAVYVDLDRPFHAPGRDVTRLLASDGDHPNAAGHRLIADVLLAALPSN